LPAVVHTPATWAGDTVVLKESARVETRYVRLLDLVEVDRLGEESRRRLDGVYLGRAPEDGAARTIGVGEIRRELEVRGIDPAGFAFAGTEVRVSGDEARPAAGVRRAIASEIRRHVLDRHPALRPEEVEVRLLDLDLEGVPAGTEVLGVRPSAGEGLNVSAFTALLTGPVRREVRGRVEVLKSRHVAVPARPRPAPAAAAVRPGDVVRAVSASFEVDARAVESGAPGAEITLEFLSTRARFRGRVVSADRVEVVEQGR
jgi:hypothetical protein